MPLIKADQSVPLFKDAIVLNMSDVAVQAEQIKASARKTAQQVIDGARAKAQKVTDDHATEGYERGYADGYKKGQAEGYEQGLARGQKEGHTQAVSEARQQFEPMVEAWHEAASAWDDYHSKLDLDARDSVIELALRLTEKILHRQLQVDPSVIVDQVTYALKSVTGATNLAIHINPEDQAVLKDVMPELKEAFSQFGHMRIVEDANVGCGGCILVHEHGRLDATLETQLRRAVELLLPGDLDVEPMPLEVPGPQQSPEAVEQTTAQAVDQVPEPTETEDKKAPDLQAQTPDAASAQQVEQIDELAALDKSSTESDAA